MVVANFSVPKVQRPEINVSASQIESQDFDVNIKVIEHNSLKGRDDENCHPIGAITGLSENLESVSEDIAIEKEERQEADGVLQEQLNDVAIKANGYIHEQGVASSEWIVQHNLDKYPSVTVVDSAENEIIAEIEYIDKNTVRITMTGASKGKAYFN